MSPNLWMCSLASFNAQFENLLSVIVTHSNDLLVSPDTPGIWDERNGPYQYGAAQICLQLDELTTSPNSIVADIVNSDAYHQSPLMDKWESMLYV